MEEIAPTVSAARMVNTGRGKLGNPEENGGFRMAEEEHPLESSVARFGRNFRHGKCVFWQNGPTMTNKDGILEELPVCFQTTPYIKMPILSQTHIAWPPNPLPSSSSSKPRSEPGVSSICEAADSGHSKLVGIRMRPSVNLT